MIVHSMCITAGLNCKKLNFNFFALSPCSHANAAQQLVETTSRPIKTPKSIAGCQKVHECTDVSTRGRHILYALVDEKDGVMAL